MKRVKLSMPSPAMIVACLALIVAMGGSAYAALSKNSVKSKQIAPKAVKTSDIADNAVKTPKLADNAVTAAELADGAVGKDEIAPLSVNLEDLNIAVTSHYVDAPLPDDGTRATALASCPPGQAIVSGGASFDFEGITLSPQTGDDLRIISSRPAITPAPGGFPNNGSTFDGWRVTAINEAGGSTSANDVTAMAVCLKTR